MESQALCKICARTTSHPSQLSCYHFLCPKCIRYILLINHLDELKSKDHIQICCDCENSGLKIFDLNEIKSILQQSTEKNSSNVQISCHNHQDQAQLYCIDCQKWLCLTCLAIHNDLFDQSVHKVIHPLLEKEKCKVHGTNALEYYCKKCHQEICSMCWTDEGQSHYSHENDKIEDYETTLKQRICSFSPDKIKEYKMVIESQISKLELHYEESMDLICNHFDSLIHVIENVKTKYIDEMKKFFERDETVMNIISSLFLHYYDDLISSSDISLLHFLNKIQYECPCIKMEKSDEALSAEIKKLICKIEEIKIIPIMNIDYAFPLSHPGKEIELSNDSLESFKDFKISKNLLKGIVEYGFERPSLIHKQTIFPIIQKKNVVVQAKSGTTKTSAFIIGTLHQIDVENNNVQTLVLEPTREHAHGTAVLYQTLGKYLNIKVYFLGTNPDVELKTKNFHVIVGTCGRVLDNVKKRYIDLSNLKSLVLDEMDEILAKGFGDTIASIFAYIPLEAQILLFSNTMPKELADFTAPYMENPINIVIEEDPELQWVKQYYVEIKSEDKFKILQQLIKFIDSNQAIIYCNSIRTVQDLTEQLGKEGYTVSSFHGQMNSRDKDQTMRFYNSGGSKFLITTDILNWHRTSFIVNYDLPREKELYNNRISSIRYGKKGYSILFVTSEEKVELVQLQTFYKTVIKALPTDISSIFE